MDLNAMTYAPARRNHLAQKGATGAKNGQMGRAFASRWPMVNRQNDQEGWRPTAPAWRGGRRRCTARDNSCQPSLFRLACKAGPDNRLGAFVACALFGRRRLGGVANCGGRRKASREAEIIDPDQTPLMTFWEKVRASAGHKWNGIKDRPPRRRLFKKHQTALAGR